MRLPSGKPGLTAPAPDRRVIALASSTARVVRPILGDGDEGGSA